MHCEEYKEITAAHVDGVLSVDERRAAELHIDTCASCMAMFAWESATSRKLKSTLQMVSAPLGAKQRLLDRLGGKEAQGRESWMLPFMNLRLAASFALLLVVVLATFVMRNGADEDFLSDAVAQYQTAIAKDPGASGRAGLSTPAARRLDLSPWGFRLYATKTYRVKGQERRVFVYQGGAEQYVLAQEFDGAKSLASLSAKTVRVKDRDFLSHSQAGVNLIAWKDKNMVCVLASNLPNDKLLSLANQLAERS